MSRQVLYSISLIFGALLIGALMIALRPDPVEDVRVAEAPLVQAVNLEAASGPIPVLGSGTVQARDEVVVGAQVAGRLTYVSPEFREGGTVSSGSVLLRIEESDYTNQVRIAQADVAAQDVAVLQAREEARIAREELDRFAQREERRVAREAGSAGTGSRILPPEQLAKPARKTPEGADAGANDADGLDAQSSDEEASRDSPLATRQPQLDSAKAARERAEASLEDARILLGRTRITSPFSGLVRSESAAIGQLVQPGEPLGSIVSTSAYEVRISLTADEAALVPGLLSGRRGQIPASVTYTFGGKAYRWPALVDRANAILDDATRNIEVYLRVPSPLTAGRLLGGGEGAERAPPLLLGAFVNAEITGASLDTYARVPAVAVRPGNEIWVVRGGKLAILPVRVIQRSDEFAFIATETLDEGGYVVTSSLTAPIEGMAVRVAGRPVE